jgi:very-short-patch-repair endonuclease
MTEAEDKLWQKIRKGKIKGLQFRRQHPLNIFIADFYCSKLKLVIEVDGEIHNLEENKEYDEGRNSYMKENGITVLRFKNEEVMENPRKVIEKIQTAIDDLLGMDTEKK